MPMNPSKRRIFQTLFFKLNSYVIKPFPGLSDDYAIIAQGKMNIAGQERDIVLDVTLVNSPDGLWLYGNQDIYQKDYQVTPHSVAGLSLFSIENKIVVHYSVQLGMQNAGLLTRKNRVREYWRTFIFEFIHYNHIP